MFEERASGTLLSTVAKRRVRFPLMTPDSPRFLHNTFAVLFRVDSITNRNYCRCLSPVWSPVKLRVAPLVRVVSRRVVTNA